MGPPRHVCLKCLAAETRLVKAIKCSWFWWEMDAGGLLSPGSIFHGQGTLCSPMRGYSSEFITLISGKYQCVHVDGRVHHRDCSSVCVYDWEISSHYRHLSCICHRGRVLILLFNMVYGVYILLCMGGNDRNYRIFSCEFLQCSIVRVIGD